VVQLVVAVPKADHHPGSQVSGTGSEQLSGLDQI
jgi:hypothetical protein